MRHDFVPDIAQLEHIVRHCGKMLLDLSAHAKSQGEWDGAQFKGGADRSAHEFLEQQLRSKYPGVPIVSEEDESSCATCAECYFIIDPIDGTASFAHGFAGWVTQVAYVREQRPIAAAIYAPTSNECFFASLGLGAYCNERRLDITTTEHRLRSLIDNYPEPRGIALEAISDLSIPAYVESGSIALKICRIADGSADLFLKDMAPRDWDLAAPSLVLEEAGGVLVDILGKPLTLGKADRCHHGLIATRNPDMLNVVTQWLDSRKQV